MSSSSNGAALKLVVAAAIALAVFSQAHGGDLQILHDRIAQGELPRDAAARTELIALADKLVASIQQDGTWAGINYADQSPADWSAERHLQNLQQVAKANAIAPDDRRLHALLLGMHWWFEHDPQNPNWWHNQIGVPEMFSETAILLGENLSPRDREKVIEIEKRSKGQTWTGQNQIWSCGIHIIRGILENNEQTTAAAYKRLYAEVKIADPAHEGILPDFSFHQHGPLLYSGGYGLVFANDIGRFVGYARGTKFQIPGDTFEIYSRYILDGERWMIRGKTFDYSAMGRALTSPGMRAVPIDGNRGPARLLGSAYGLQSVASSLAEFDSPRRDEFAALADELNGKRPSAVSGNRHFWCSDYMAHQRPEFFVSVRMFSSRTINSELVNDQGKQSHHLADGCTMLYRTGDEYADIFPVWDWKKIPGTTAEQFDLAAEPKGNHMKGKTDFVGGVSDGAFGVAAQDLIHGGLTAKKFWMFLDHGFVALGSGISCGGDRNVITTLNQCLASAPPKVQDDSVAEGGFRYFIPKPQKFEMKSGPQSGSWSDIGPGSKDVLTKNVFTLTIDHGIKPQDADYNYSVWIDGAPKPDIQILSNTRSLQAVRDRTSNIVGAAFWSAGSVKIGERHSIAVDQPCLALRRGDQISVSNPANQQLTVHVTIDNNAPLTIDLPGGAMAGSTVTRTISPN